MTTEIEQFSEEEASELRRVYYAGAHEILESLQDALLAYEKDQREELLKTIKRYVHTLKGDSYSLGLQPVGNLCHRLEDVLPSLLAGSLREALDILLAGVDALRALVDRSEAGEDVGEDEILVRRIDEYLGKNDWNPAAAASVPASNQEPEAAVKKLRVYRVDVGFHPECREKSVAARMVLQRLSKHGRVLLTVPSVESREIDSAEGMAFIITTERDSEPLLREAAIAGIAVDVKVNEHQFDCPGGWQTPEKTVATESIFAENRAVINKAEKIGSSLSAVPGAGSAEYLRIEASRVDRVMNLAAELIIGRSMIEQVLREFDSGVPAQDLVARLRSANAYLERSVSDLQKGVMKMRMVPVHQVFRKFPRMVRDLSDEKKKPVRLEITGKETELDKGVVDALAEPLTHIIRNMIDHGIEEPSKRIALGKTPEGLVTLGAFHEGSQVVIEIADDGRGINTGKLKQKAVEQGFLHQEEAAGITDVQAWNLMFLPGLSTADTVTDTSGRGVGMDAVKASVEDMRGAIEVRSTPGSGTIMRLRLPLTLAVIRALLFEAGGKLYAMPVTAISEVTKVTTDAIRTVHGNRTLVIRDQVISLISLRELLQTGEERAGKKFALIAGIGEKNVGLLVDRLLGQQELVIKAVDIPRESGLIAGASILGDGKVAMVLDVRALVEAAVDSTRRRLATA